MRRKRHLHDNAVHLRIPVERLDRALELGLSCLACKLYVAEGKAGPLASGPKRADIRLGRRVRPDFDGYQRGRPTELCCEGGSLDPQLSAQRSGDRASVEDQRHRLTILPCFEGFEPGIYLRLWELGLRTRTLAAPALERAALGCRSVYLCCE